MTKTLIAAVLAPRDERALDKIRRHDGSTVPAVLAIIAKDAGQKPDQIKPAIAYVDPDAMLDVKDVQHQIDWYVSQGTLRSRVDANSVIDKRYVVALSP
jgi:hypothetical protein